MNTLVTGAAGFIGAHVAERLLRNGHSVVALDDLSGGFVENVPPGAEFVRGSVCDRDWVESLFARRRFDAVFHLAAYAAEGLSHFIKRFNYENNLAGSVNLLSCAVNHDLRLFVFTSSIAVYGHAEPPMTEDMRPAPVDSYGIAKYAFELELEATRAVFGLPYVIFRPHNVYGEKQNIADRYRNVVGIFMRQALQGETMTVFGDGLQTRAFSHVDDVAPIIADALDRPDCWNQAFNVGADQPYTVLQIAEEVAKALAVQKRIVHLPPRVEVVHAFADHSKVRRFFGDRPLVSLSEGIARMAVWAKRRGVPPATPAPPVEIPRNLPGGWVQ
ncbi:MAG: NAD-dependent epimerase/dehydratase family protein [Candidatus Sumerlaeota bacterium]|nr:NAD-dependent epimerase/dehydratase family protein [Candidatus Sumerlaeota bacterium]